MSEKTETATPYQLKKAKERGQVSKSVELNSCVFLLAMLATATALSTASLTSIKALCMNLVLFTARISINVDTTLHLMNYLLLSLISLWIPYALSGMVSIILASIAQTGLVWSATPIQADFKRLNIVLGLKRLCSSKLLFDTLKNSFKLTIVCILLFLSLRHEQPAFFHMMRADTTQFPVLFISLLTRIVLQLLSILLALAAIDKLYTKWKFAKDHRMSKQELKDEYRQREGDPKIKFKIKQLQQQLRQKTASLQQVKTADVVITNPTHLAIVLKYDRGFMPAPKVVCKAQGAQVKQVKKLALRHHVPIVENKPLARMLFANSTINQWIDREYFPMVALIFRDIYRQQGAK